MHVYHFNVKIPKDSQGVYVAVYKNNVIVRTAWSVSDLSCAFADAHKDADLVAFVQEETRFTQSSSGWSIQPVESKA